MPEWFYEVKLNLQLGLKLSSEDTNYTRDINSFYESGYFQYIELFAAIDSYNDTIEYWKQFHIPIIIHAPHSFAGMNLSLQKERKNNKIKLKETFNFAHTLKSEYILFHSGVDGDIEETITQLRPYADSRCLIENKPIKGINGEKCLGSTPDEIKYINNELNAGFCLDFGHAICAANTMKIDTMDFINNFLILDPKMYHLTDGNYESETDTHFHYGKGNFPIKELFKIIHDGIKVTNEARNDSNNDLNEFKDDYIYVKNL